MPNDSDLTVRFAAYAESFHPRVTAIFRKEAPRDELLFDLDLGTSQWAVGTEVTVSLTARGGLEVETSLQRFTWDGNYEVLHFASWCRRSASPGPTS